METGALRDEHVDATLRAVSPKYVGAVVVSMPPTWKDPDPTPFTFALFEDEPDSVELQDFFQSSIALGLTNPRPITRQLLEAASVFHPLMYAHWLRDTSLQNGRIGDFLKTVGGGRVLITSPSPVPVPTIRYYLQSLLFLGGCTLSAAVVQGRFSQGTIESKLVRLWQAASYSRRFGFDEFNKLGVEDFVISCDASRSAPNDRLIEIKRMYASAVGCLVGGLPIRRAHIVQTSLSAEDRERFGFVPELRYLLGSDLLCVLVYGSAVTSKDFADYDTVLVVRDASEALQKLAGAKPVHHGRDINVSIYEPHELLAFQAASGDNLDHNARCVFGEAEIPIKSPSDLMLRNFSFAFVRLRQLLGMAGFLAARGVHSGIDQTNMYEYFVKIPMHIMKGVRSAVREHIAKEYLTSWIASAFGYDLQLQLDRIRHGQFAQSISDAYLATRLVLAHLNKVYRAFEVVPAGEADLWKSLEAPVKKPASGDGDAVFEPD